MSEAIDEHENTQASGSRESSEPQIRVFRDGSRSYSPHAVEITPGNYHRYRYQTKEDGSSIWTENMQPIDWETWKAEQESLRIPEETQPAADLSVMEQAIEELVRSLGEQNQALLDRLQEMADRADQQDENVRQQIQAIRDLINQQGQNHNQQMQAMQNLLNQLINNPNLVPPAPAPPAQPPAPAPPAPQPAPAPQPPNPPQPPAPGANNPNIQPRSALDIATEDLARLTIRRRGRLFGGLFRGRGVRHDYELAYQDYEQAKIDTLTQLRDQLRQQGNLSEDQIVETVAAREYAMQREFAQAVHDIDQRNYEQSQQAGGIRAWYERTLKNWSNYSWKRKLLISVLAGGAATIAVGATAGFGLAALAAGTGVRYSVAMLNRTASARNRAATELGHEQVRIQREEERDRLNRRRSLLRLGGAADSDAYLADVAHREHHYHSGERRRADRRNLTGSLIMLGGAAAAGLGVAGVEFIPGFSGLWHPFGGNKIDWSDFHPGSFHGPTGAAAVHNMAHVFEHNGYHVHGLTPERVRLINQAMIRQHIHMASGMAADQHGLHQNIIDWPGLNQHVSNWAVGGSRGGWEGLQYSNGSTIPNWKVVAQIFQDNGVSITR